MFFASAYKEEIVCHWFIISVNGVYSSNCFAAKLEPLNTWPINLQIIYSAYLLYAEFRVVRVCIFKIEDVIACTTVYQCVLETSHA